MEDNNIGDEDTFTYTLNLIFSSFFGDNCTPCGWSMRNHKIKTPLRPLTSTFIISGENDQIKVAFEFQMGTPLLRRPLSPLHPLHNNRAARPPLKRVELKRPQPSISARSEPPQPPQGRRHCSEAVADAPTTTTSTRTRMQTASSSSALVTIL